MGETPGARLRSGRRGSSAPKRAAIWSVGGITAPPRWPGALVRRAMTCCSVASAIGKGSGIGWVADTTQTAKPGRRITCWLT